MNITTRDYVVALAGFLGEHGTTMSIEELVEHLDRNHFPTACGPARDVDGRHIVKVLTSLSEALSNDERHEEAQTVIDSFVEDDGTYAFDSTNAHEDPLGSLAIEFCEPKVGRVQN
jgi:hypothetical protein